MPAHTICVVCREREQELARASSSSVEVRMKIAKRIVSKETESVATEMPLHFIRTYNRPAIPTLHFCHKIRLENPPFIVLAGKQEDPAFDKYLQYFKENGHFRRILIGVKGCGPVVSFIHDLVPRDTHVIVMDDNVTNIALAHKKRKRSQDDEFANGSGLFSNRRWRSFLEHAEAVMRVENVAFWGVANSANPMSCKIDLPWFDRRHLDAETVFGQYVTNEPHIYGATFGMLTQSGGVKQKLIVTGKDSTDDMERGIRHLMLKKKCLVFPQILVTKRIMDGGLDRKRMSDKQIQLDRLEVFRQHFPKEPYVGKPKNRSKSQPISLRPYAMDWLRYGRFKSWCKGAVQMFMEETGNEF